MTLYLILALLLGLLILAALIYNALVKARQLAQAGWSDIDVQLKRRADLIPQLVTTVKGYAKHERQLFTEIVERRNAAAEAGDAQDSRAEAERKLGQSARKLFAVAEDYPDLKASQNFLDLQDELSETEDKIEMARRYYNGAVREMNTKIQTFPINIMAGPLGFKSAPYFQIEASDRVVPSV